MEELICYNRGCVQKKFLPKENDENESKIDIHVHVAWACEAGSADCMYLCPFFCQIRVRSIPELRTSTMRTRDGPAVISSLRISPSSSTIPDAPRASTTTSSPSSRRKSRETSTRKNPWNKSRSENPFPPSRSWPPGPLPQRR